VQALSTVQARSCPTPAGHPSLLLPRLPATGTHRSPPLLLFLGRPGRPVVALTNTNVATVVTAICLSVCLERLGEVGLWDLISRSI
jgi:hypothetical protein